MKRRTRSALIGRACLLALPASASAASAAACPSVVNPARVAGGPG
jgi:hypothetical protein